MKKVMAGVVIAAFCIGIMGCGKAELEAKNKEIADLTAKVTTLEQENTDLKAQLAKIEEEKKAAAEAAAMKPKRKTRTRRVR